MCICTYEQWQTRDLEKKGDIKMTNAVTVWSSGDPKVARKMMFM